MSAAGTTSPYSGLLELKSSVITKLTKEDCPNVVVPTTLAITAENSPTIATNMASRPATITQGTVTSVAGSIGGNITVKVKVGTMAYTVFENSTYAAADDYATFSQTRSGATAATIIAVNDIVDLSGITSFYTDPQIISAKITKWTEGVAPKDTVITMGRNGSMFSATLAFKPIGAGVAPWSAKTNSVTAPRPSKRTIMWLSPRIT